MKRCIECNRRKKLFENNFAGFNVRDVQPYPERIKELVLSGDKKKDFLCIDCANTRKFECTVHGIFVADKYHPDEIPICPGCHRDEWAEYRAKDPGRRFRSPSLEEMREKGEIKLVEFFNCRLIKSFFSMTQSDYEIGLTDKKIYLCPYGGFVSYGYSATFWSIPWQSVTKYEFSGEKEGLFTYKILDLKFLHEGMEKTLQFKVRVIEPHEPEYSLYSLEEMVGLDCYKMIKAGLPSKELAKICRVIEVRPDSY